MQKKKGRQRLLKNRKDQTIQKKDNFTGLLEAPVYKKAGTIQAGFLKNRFCGGVSEEGYVGV